MFTARAAAKLRQRLLVAMSMDEAKGLLGFPPGSSPTPREVNKAYKTMAFRNHPDRGGDPRRMVELNVAKDILTGKRTRDLTEVRQEDPMVAKRHAAIIAVQKARDKLVPKAKGIVLRLRSSFNSEYVEDLGAYLLQDLPEHIDRLLDWADTALADEQTSAEDRKNWKDAQREAEAVMGLALRTSKKFRELQETTARLYDTTLFGHELYDLDKSVEPFLAAFRALAKRSGKLTSLLNTTETVPMFMADKVNDAHGMITAYRDDFEQLERFLGTETKNIEEAIKAAIKAVLDTLRELSIVKWFPEWYDWGIPETFDEVIELIKSGANRRNASMASRVVVRHAAKSKFRHYEPARRKRELGRINDYLMDLDEEGALDRLPREIQRIVGLSRKLTEAEEDVLLEWGEANTPGYY